MNSFAMIIVPDAEDADAAEVYVEASVGTARYRFLLDTGAATTCLPLDDYTATFPSVGRSNSSGVFAAISEELVIVPRIELGPIVKTDLTVARLREKNPQRSNLIGMDVLKDASCHFCFDAGRVYVEPSGRALLGYPAHAVSYDRRLHPYIEVHFPAVTAGAHWDTGAGMTIADLAFVTKHPALFTAAGHSQGTDAGGVTMETPMFIMAASTIGGRVFPAHRVAAVDLARVNATTDRPMDLILGYSTYSKANWLFDFPAGQWAITKLLGAPSDAA
jgi:hypothetical protein